MDLKKIAVALVLLPLFLLLIGWAPVWSLLLVFVILGCGLGGWEYARIAFGEQQNWFDTSLVVLFSALVCVAVTWLPANQLLAVLSGAFLVISIACMLKSDDLSAVLTRAAKVFFGVMLLGYLGGFIVALKGLEADMGGFKLVIFLFALIWGNDSGAYFAGTLKGKNKLAPKISPGKTIEGSIGGFAATLLVALVVAGISDQFNWQDALILGLVMALVGPIGDLFESALKRGAGVKDSGTLLPGHGGIYDRIDSVLFGAPVLYFYVLFRIIN